MRPRQAAAFLEEQCRAAMQQALARAEERLAPYGKRCHLFALEYASFEEALDTLGWNQVDGALLERYSDLEALTKKIRAKLKTVLGIDAKVTLVQPKTIERFAGKAKRVVDLRNQS